MFVAKALFDFSPATMQPIVDPLQQTEEATLKRSRSPEQEQELAELDGGAQPPITYLSFSAGETILVKEAFQNGWWQGHVIIRPESIGYFPSTYVQVGAKPPKPKPEAQQAEKDADYEAAEQDQINARVEKAELIEKGGKDGPVDSSYYQGITGYKYVKINDKNKNILNASYVKFDVSTGLARVPIKSQAPAAKETRMMGYYFDYHEWNDQKNKNPQLFRNRPNPKLKRQKRLKLKGMD